MDRLIQENDEVKHISEDNVETVEAPKEPQKSQEPEKPANTDEQE